jgi:uncharacterized oligopeptide transporter (OPT) family protein
MSRPSVKRNAKTEAMIAISKVYNYLSGIFLFGLLLAVSGFLLAYLGHGYFGWLLGVCGSVLCMLGLLTFWIIRIFGKRIKFINFDETTVFGKRFKF